MIQTSKRHTAALAAIIICIGFAAPASAVQIEGVWGGGAGDWNNGSLWTFDVPPASQTFPNNDPGNSEFFDVLIDDGDLAVSTVNLNVPVTIDSLILDAADALGVNNGMVLTIVRDAGRAGSGTIDNDATITFSSSNTGA